MNMGLDYGVLRARPDRSKREDDGSTPHLQIRRSTRAASRGGSRSTCSPTTAATSSSGSSIRWSGIPSSGRWPRLRRGSHHRRHLGGIAGLRQGTAVRMGAGPRPAADRQRQRRRPAGPPRRSTWTSARPPEASCTRSAPSSTAICTSRSTPSSATPTGCTGSTTSTSTRATSAPTPATTGRSTTVACCWRSPTGCSGCSSPSRPNAFRPTPPGRPPQARNHFHRSSHRRGPGPASLHRQRRSTSSGR